MRRSRALNLVTLSLSLSLTVLAGCGSPKKTWLMTMKLALPSTVCGTDLFSECFDWAGGECRELIRPEIDVCAEELEPQLPSQVGPIAGREWGEKLGACVGMRLEEAQIERIRITPACEEAVQDLGHTVVDFKAEVAAIREARGLPPLEE